MIQTVRGVRDILPEETGVWQFLEDAARQVFTQYGYQEIRTPIFEKTELFERAVGTSSDIVEKEMYTFADRGGDAITLRPEGTAAVVRALIEHSLYRQLPWPVYYMGPMFRYERPQKGRYRQFHQIGCELFGAAGPRADAEMMLMVLRLLRSIGLEKTLTLELNSLGCPTCRTPYRAQLLTFLHAHRDRVCPNCLQRMERNPLRVLDCKEASCRSVARQAPCMPDHLCSACADHWTVLTEHLTRLQVPFTRNPWMVRGLDYYNRTTFEVTTTALGAQNAVAAGGRYDGLVSAMGGKETPAIGFAMGVERLVMLMEATRAPVVRPPLYLAAIGAEAERAGMALIETLRDDGLSVILDRLGGSMKSQLKRAHRSQARFTLILGDQEVAERTLLVKQMDDGKQHLLTGDHVAAQLRALLKTDNVT